MAPLTREALSAMWDELQEEWKNKCDFVTFLLQ
jgi:hypothetical protein